jgi:hypothetical protein
MRHIFFLVIFTLFIHQLGQTQTTNISGVVNTYTSFEGFSDDTIEVASAAGFSAGDKILVIQMQGATINQNNNSSFGSVNDLNNAGNYEFTTICGVTSNKLVVTGLDRSYTASGHTQVIRVPQYVNAIVTAPLTADPWNGATGGVLVFECSGTLTLNDDIDLSGLGFRGGATTTSSYACSWFANLSGYYYNISTGEGAKKGEGIATYINGKTGGRGAQASGGGGSNDHNGGGGGGANAGDGGTGGQRIPPSTFSCSCANPGLGGIEMTYSNAMNRVFLGGGGGAGHENNTNTSTDGGNGGGIILITAGTLVGNGNIIQSRGSEISINSADGAGGGGAGGSVLLDVQSYSGSVTVDVSGSDGGDVANVGNNCNGPGGGGSGGLIWVSQSSLPTNITSILDGGASGTTISTTQSNCNVGSTNSATNGSTGEVVTGLSMSESICDIPLTTRFDTICGGDSLFVGGNWRHQSGTFYDSLSRGCCDSTVKTVLWVLAEKSGSINDTICEGDSLVVNGTSYTSSVSDATEVITGVGPYGCDSTVNIQLTVNTIDVGVTSNSPTLSANADSASYQWIRCPELTIITDSTSKSFTASENGLYAVIVSKDGCSDTSACFEINSLGIIENSFGEAFQLFPNPTQGQLSIDFGQTYEELNLQLSDVSGRLLNQWQIHDQQATQLQLNQPAGTYLLRIEANEHHAAIRIIIE